MLTFIICLFIYLIIGVGVIYWFAGKSSKEENAAWVLIYAFGPFIWPIILYNYFFRL